MAGKKKAKTKAVLTKSRIVKPKAKAVKLSVVGKNIAAQYAPITKKQFKLLTTDSSAASDLWSKLADNLSSGDGVFEEGGLFPEEFEVYVDDISLAAATVELNKKAKADISKPSAQKYGNDDYFVVRTEMAKGATYTMNIRGKFDPKKLAVSISRDELPDGSVLEIAYVTYDGRDLESQGGGSPWMEDVCAAHPKTGKVIS